MCEQILLMDPCGLDGLEHVGDLHTYVSFPHPSWGILPIDLICRLHLIIYHTVLYLYFNAYL